MPTDRSGAAYESGRLAQAVSEANQTQDNRRLRIHITGRVQGVGFRPFVWNLAARCGLTGWVQNTSSGVAIEIQGAPDHVDGFLDELGRRPPRLVGIDSLRTEDIAVERETRFLIRRSVKQHLESNPVVPDLSVCADCLRELQDPNDRRFQYPFINCTNCGPRFTIVQDLPYDREATTMSRFEMCPACQKEYDDPQNRRFHAQPNACPECGPQIWFATPSDDDSVIRRPQVRQDQTKVLRQVRSAIAAGSILAIKGIGGFHLACDATNLSAVEKLRQRKGRMDKPFAVMVPTVADAESLALIGDTAKELLQSVERPIVLLPKRGDAGNAKMLDAIAPRNGQVGLMLPYSPLHELLFYDATALVMTSGNLSEEPIATTNAEAFERLGSLVDGFLFHDREIHAACDDSVVRMHDEKVLPIRRSRGYAPMPIRLDGNAPSVLAVGGDLKSTFCVTKGDYAYTSQHLGDLENLPTIKALEASVDHFLTLFRVHPEAIVADLHPDYHSTRFAQTLAESMGVPLLRIQHHFAHAVSLQAEHAWDPGRPLLACCFDGAGYGNDGAIWGGEILTIRGADFQRSAHLRYFSLPGGDRAVRQSFRIACSLLHDLGMADRSTVPAAAACSENQWQLMRRQIQQGINCPPTSSIGRLFDGVASLIGVRQHNTYEAQAAIELESLAADAIEEASAEFYSFGVLDRSTTQGQPIQIDWAPMVKGICVDLDRKADQALIAAKFHHCVAAMIAKICVELRQINSINSVGLTGGVFQNTLLLGLAESGLIESGFEVLTHSVLPPGDGGLAVGQAVAAQRQLKQAAS